MIIKNGKVFLEDFEFHNVDVRLENDRITEIGEGLTGGEVYDAAGGFVVPGFVDVHTHGAVAHDFCEGTEEAFSSIAGYLASQGVTSYCGTSLTYESNALKHAFAHAGDFIARPRERCAAMVGINMEGPFINVGKKGAQPEKYIIKPDREFFDELWKLSNGGIKLCDLAPEIEGAMEFIEYATKKTRISLAHTEADYDCASEAFRRGAKHITHTFNAMPALSHRAPGVIGAAYDFADTVELICDGYHVMPPVIRMMFAMFGPQRICLISDALMCCGVPDGEYELGGQKVFVAKGKATLENGTIAGSSTSLAECFRRTVRFGIRAEDALRAATATPAQALGMYDEIGGIAAGKRADVVILDGDYAKKDVFLRGCRL